MKRVIVSRLLAMLLQGAAAWAAALGCPAVQAQAASAPSAQAQLQALALQGRSHPEEAAAELSRWVERMPETDGQRLAALEQLGTLRARLNDPDKAEQVALQLDNLARQGGPSAARAQLAARMVRANVVFHTATSSRAERLVNEAMAHLPPDLPPRLHLQYLELAGDVQERGGHLDESVRLYLQALQLADQSSPAWERSEVRSSLAYTLFEAGQKERARSLNTEALSLAREAGDDLALAAAMTTESVLAADRHDDVAELASLRAAIDHSRKAGSKRDEILTLANLADFYLKHAQYETALEVSQRALPLAREVHNRGSESLALTNMGLALISLHRKAEGLKAVQAGLAIEESSGAITSMADTYRELGEYLEKAGDQKEAFDAFRQHRRLSGEVFRQEQQQAILELQEGYDNERRNRDLELLNRQNRLKEEQLLQHELRQRLWALGAAVLLLLLGVVVLLVQRGRRANRLLASTNEQLKVQSERDPLTGLANRRHFRHAMRRLAEDGCIEGTIYLLDIDHFKRINDVHGHAAGDAVLVEVARRLCATLRDEDLVVRWGGEEFLVVVQSLAPDQVETLAQRLLNVVGSQAIAVGERSIAVTTSIGFASFPLEPGNVTLPWERAIELVDTAMYLAKAHGRNRGYGIRLLHARDAAEVEPIARTLEQSWREGRVALVELTGVGIEQEATA